MRAGSLILSRLGKWSSRAFWSLGNGLGGRLFCGGDETEKALDNCLGARAARAVGLGEKVIAPYKDAIAEGAFQSRLFLFADRFRKAFFLTKVRFFGIAGLLFALYSLAGFFLYQFFSFSYSRTSLADLILGAAVLAGSVVLLFVGKPAGECLAGSRLFGRLFIGVLGIDPGSLRQTTGQPMSHGALAFVIGTVWGVAGIFLAPHRVVLWTVQLIFAILILAVPETGLLSAVLLMPVCSLDVTAAFVAATLVSYFIKLIRLKRTIRLRVPETMMLLMLLSVFLASRGSFAGEDAGRIFLTYLLFGCVWFLTVNLVKTGTLYRKLIACLMYGGMTTLVLTGAGFLLQAFRLDDWHALLPQSMLAQSVLGMYLVILVPVTLLHGKRWSGLAMLALVALNAYFLQSMWVWFGILASVLVYLVFAKRALFESVLAGVILIPMFVIAAGNRLGAFSVRISESAGALAREYWLCGLGLGERVLAVGAAANGLVPDGFSANLYERMILEGGAVHLLLFLLAAAFSLQYVFTAMRNTQSGNAKTICGGIAAAVLMFLACGFATDVGADLRVIGLFWCLCPAASLAKDLYGRKPEDP